MGKWTPEYVDDVLHHKLKNLVYGAIKRTALEKTEPTISYENFVNDLDIGDSFTTSLVEILVKELAERRTRPSQSDKRLIADRSAKSLRLLATPLRVYHGRSMGRHHHNRRTTTLSDYLTIPPVEMDTEEDEEMFETASSNPTPIEGIQTNTDLYDAYTSRGITIFRGPRSPSPSAEEAQASSSTQPSGSRHAWASVESNAPAVPLTRQPSIRRLGRSRTIDFNDFTSRRRSANRETQGTRGEGEEATEPREGWTRNPQATRRFFPFARTRRNESSADYAWNERQAALAEDQERHWFDVSPIHLDSMAMDEFIGAAVSDERARSITPRPNFPRLRRGGLRAPESILSRHASPAGMPSPRAEELAVILPSPPRHVPDLLEGEPTSYPTPSTEPDTSS